MKLAYLLTEAFFKTYTAMIQIKYEGESPTRIAELIRALPGVTTVQLASHNKQNNIMVVKVKLITQKTGDAAFENMKRNAMKRYIEIKGINIGSETIELKRHTK